MLGDVEWSLYASAALPGRHRRPRIRALAGHEVLGFESRLAGVPGARWLEAHGGGGERGHALPRAHRHGRPASPGSASPSCLASPPRSSPPYAPHPEVLGSGRLAIVYRKEVLLAEPVRAVIEFVTEAMRQHADRMSGRV